MENTRKITSILALAVAFCFGLASLAQAEKPPWAGDVLVEPIWVITQDGTDISVEWEDHAPNPRFAIYDPNGDSDPADEMTLYDDLVLDKETGLVWARNANLFDQPRTWQEAMRRCRQSQLGNRQGWRLPTVEELSSLADKRNSPRFPSGHPFINVQSAGYWSSTTDESDSTKAWLVHTHLGVLDGYPKEPVDTLLYAWPVRGGNGYAAGNW